MQPDEFVSAEARFFEMLRSLAERVETHLGFKFWLLPMVDSYYSGKWSALTPSEKKEKLDYCAFSIVKSDIGWTLDRAFPDREFSREFSKAARRYEMLVDQAEGVGSPPQVTQPSDGSDAAELSGETE